MSSWADSPKWRRTRRSVAFKELHVTEGSVNALLASQFEREYHTLVQLNHPSIIEVYDYGVDQRGYPFYTMELQLGMGWCGR
jgi:serine/threonine protein kinase